MRSKGSIFYSTLILTGVHLLLRLIGTSFQIYLSGAIGAEGIGLLQLTLSAGGFAMTAGMAGIRTCTMYLTAEELGKKKEENTPWILSTCMRYSLLTGGIAAVILYFLSPAIGKVWIGDTRIIPSLGLFSGFMLVNCLCGVMTGMYTAEGRIGTLAAAEVAEQLFSMAVTILCLANCPPGAPEKACESVILGSGAGSCMTLALLAALKHRRRVSPGPRISARERIVSTAVPLALGDLARSGISTAENMLVPKRLALYPGCLSPLASFGILTGMVFPVLMFPACILHALSDLLIPELARCAASENQTRIRYIVKRCLGTALLYGLLSGGLLHLTADTLGRVLYREPAAGTMLKSYALMAPMLYCDSLTDAMTKGLGQQRACVKYNIITSLADVAGLFLLLPRLGMTGYYISFMISHGINFILSLNRLVKISKIRLPFPFIAYSLLSVTAALMLCRQIPWTVMRAIVFVILCCAFFRIFGVVGKDSLRWFLSMIHPRPISMKRAAS